MSAYNQQANVSPRSRMAAALMAFFLGWLGVHRFYVGKVGTAILMVLTVGGFGIWATIDLIMILVGAFTDDAGRPLLRWDADVRPSASQVNASQANAGEGDLDAGQLVEKAGRQQVRRGPDDRGDAADRGPVGDHQQDRRVETPGSSLHRPAPGRGPDDHRWLL